MLRPDPHLSEDEQRKRFWDIIQVYLAAEAVKAERFERRLAQAAAIAYKEQRK